MLATLFLGGTAIALDLPPYTAAVAAAAAPSMPYNPEPPQDHPVLIGLPNLFTKEWWLYLAGIKPSAAAAIAAPSQVEIIAPTVDDTDAEWWGVGSVNATDDPATFTATFTGQSRHKIKMSVDNGGLGYSSGPGVTITGADGGGWAAGSVATIAAGVVVSVSAPTSWYGLLAPLTVTLTGGGGSQAVVTAKLGRQFAEGDLVVWNDPTIVGQLRSYELAQITGIAPIDATHANITIARAAAGAAAGDGTALYGSMKSAHAAAEFYRLQNNRFLRPFSLAAGPQDIHVGWDSETIPAVQVTLPGQAPAIINLAPRVYLPGTATLDPRTQPPAPGVRTMNFAAYTTLGVAGPLAIGMTADARVPMQARAALRAIYARVLTAPTGAVSFHGDANACIVVYVCYLAPPDGAGNRAVGLVDTLVIDTGLFTSYPDTSSITPAPNVPDGRQMPYHAYWPVTLPHVDWPTTRLPICTSLVLGKLALPFAVDPPSTIPLAPDGEFDLIIAQVGSSITGSDLSLSFQT